MEVVRERLLGELSGRCHVVGDTSNSEYDTRRHVSWPRDALGTSRPCSGRDIAALVARGPLAAGSPVACCSTVGGVSAFGPERGCVSIGGEFHAGSGVTARRTLRASPRTLGFPSGSRGTAMNLGRVIMWMRRARRDAVCRRGIEPFGNLGYLLEQAGELALACDCHQHRGLGDKCRGAGDVQQGYLAEVGARSSRRDQPVCSMTSTSPSKSMKNSRPVVPSCVSVPCRPGARATSRVAMRRAAS